MNKEIRYYFNLHRKVFILRYAKDIGNNMKVIREFGIPKSTFYKWKKAYDHGGVEGLLRKKPVAYHHPKSVKPDVEEKILHLRKEFKLGPCRIMWYLERYHGIKVSESSVYRTLRRHGVSKMDKNAPRRAIHTKRYCKLPCF